MATTPSILAAAAFWALSSPASQRGPAAGPTAQRATSSKTVQLQVTVDLDKTTDAATQARVNKRLRAATSDLGFTDANGADLVLHIDISWEAEGSADLMIRLFGNAQNGYPASQRESRCAGCTEDQLLDAVAVVVKKRLTELTKERTAPDPQPQPQLAPPQDVHQKPRVALFATGLTLTPLGAIALGAGAALWARGEQRTFIGERARITNYRPTGITLAAGGTLVMAAGVTLAIVSQMNRRSRRTVVFVAPTSNSATLHAIARF